jgi:hypothetical protein
MTIFSLHNLVWYQTDDFHINFINYEVSKNNLFFYLDISFSLCVQSTGCLVQENKSGCFEDCPSNGNPLLLPTT